MVGGGGGIQYNPSCRLTAVLRLVLLLNLGEFGTKSFRNHTCENFCDKQLQMLKCCSQTKSRDIFSFIYPYNLPGEKMFLYCMSNIDVTIPNKIGKVKSIKNFNLFTQISVYKLHKKVNCDDFLIFLICLFCKINKKVSTKVSDRILSKYYCEL